VHSRLRVRCIRSCRPFLLRRAGLDEIGEDPKADPPDGERGEPAERLGGKGDPVIGADAPGQAVLAKQALEDGPGLAQLGTGEALTGEQQAAVAVRHRERETVLPIAQLKLALVVGGPDGIGRLHLRARRPGRSRSAQAAAGSDEAQVLEAARDGGAHRPGRLGPALAHQAEQLPRPPVRMAVMGLEQALEQHRIECRG
jgi:hypothetical protein